MFVHMYRHSSYPMAGVFDRPDGQRVALVAGGLATNVSPSFAFDSVALLYLSTMSWAEGPPLPQGRYGASAVQYR